MLEFFTIYLGSMLVLELANLYKLIQKHLLYLCYFYLNQMYFKMEYFTFPNIRKKSPR